MLRNVLEARIQQYQPANALEQESVLQEIMQQYILLSLSRSNFFSRALFHGGTCLRLFYRLGRFSEDLDFMLRGPDRSFAWTSYLADIRRDCEAEGIHFEKVDRSAADNAVKKAFLKTDSIGTLIMLELPFNRDTRSKIRVKLEIDTNPPMGSVFESHFLTFPSPAVVTTQDLSSGFGTKIHALLCRNYAKGRDWYDFLWYVGQRVKPNYVLLRNALKQVGPWAGQSLSIDSDWLVSQLAERIKSLDWIAVREDVRRFLGQRDQASLDLWNTELFLYYAKQMENYLID